MPERGVDHLSKALLLNPQQCCRVPGHIDCGTDQDALPRAWISSEKVTETFERRPRHRSTPRLREASHAQGVSWVGSNERKRAGDASPHGVHAALANRGHPAERIAGKFRRRVIHTHAKAASRTFALRRHPLSALYILMNKCRGGVPAEMLPKRRWARR
jgi:hypothetical protein